MPCKIALLNMPFASLPAPSIGLTQIKSRLKEKFGDSVDVTIHYLNQEFACEIGEDLYGEISNSINTLNSGLGEWIFRQVAFPQCEDNFNEYFKRYFPSKREAQFKSTILRSRERLDEVMNNLIDKYDIHQADIVGLTSLFAQNNACFAMSRILKSRNERIINIMGGGNCLTPMGDEIIKNTETIDYVFSGPSLISFPEFVEKYIIGDIKACDNIKGVFSKVNHNVLRLDNIEKIGDELDINIEVKLDYTDFLDSFENNFPNGKIKPHLFFETSRGCWWGERCQCKFCGLNGMSLKYKSKNPEQAIRHFKSLFKYSDRCKFFWCVDNIMPKHYTNEVLPFLNTPDDVIIMYETKADLSTEDLNTLFSSGVKLIQPGIESLNTKTLKLMRKGTSALRNILLLKNSLENGISVKWNLLVGFPGETEDSYIRYDKILPNLFHLEPPSGPLPLRFDRYSVYFRNADEYDLDLKPYDFYEMVYPFSNESIKNIAYYFMDKNYSAEYFSIMLKWFFNLKEKIDLWSKKWRNGNSFPQLFFKNNEKNVVFDSRNGTVIEHEVGDIGKQVLEAVAKPINILNLTSYLHHYSKTVIENEVELLNDKGLVLKEFDSIISLVMPNEASRPFFA